MSDSDISIHNSAGELAQTPELIQRLRLEQLLFRRGDHALPFCQKVTCPGRPEAPALLMFLHGAGSVGHDNFLQVRIPAEPLIRYCESREIKAVLLFPQCERNFQWVNVPWNTESHLMPETPSLHLSMAMELLREKIKEFQPDRERVYGIGISMGGYGIWDLACRMPDVFAALAAICGGADTTKAPLLKNVASCLIHGTDDTAVPVIRSRSMAEALRRAGNTRVFYREMPGFQHNVWDAFFADQKGLDWLFSQRRIIPENKELK